MCVPNQIERWKKRFRHNYLNITIIIWKFIENPIDLSTVELKWNTLQTINNINSNYE